MKRVALLAVLAACLAALWPQGGRVEAHGEVRPKMGTQTVAHLVWASPAASDEWVVRLPAWDSGGTMTGIYCECYGSTSVTINICDGEDTGDDTCATSIPGATMTCDTTGVSDTTLNAPGFASQDKVTLVVTAVSGTPASVEVTITGTMLP